MSTDNGIFREYIKPIITTTLSGLFFVVWWSWTEGVEADKQAKSNLFGKWDTEQQAKLDKSEAREIVLEERHYQLLLKYIDEKDNCN